MKVRDSLQWTMRVRRAMVDEDFEANQITVKHTNSHRDRHIPLNDVLRKTLRRMHMKALERAQALPASIRDKYVFENPKTDYHYADIKTAWQSALLRAGISGLRFQDLRHTAATRMIKKGARITAVQKLLGHADLSTTSRYLHVVPDDTDLAVRLLAQSDVAQRKSIVEEANLG